jgi:hypothetical protein
MIVITSYRRVGGILRCEFIYVGVDERQVHSSDLRELSFSTPSTPGLEIYGRSDKIA